MRFLFALAAYAALTVSAFAQGTSQSSPKEIDQLSTIRVYPGETRVFTFDQPIAEIRSTGENVKIIPESDRTYAFVGVSPGSSILTALNADRQLVYRARVIVAGTTVRIYGTSTVDEKRSDYVGYICTDIGCGRADLDRPSDTSASVSRTRRNSRGELITTTTNRD